MSEAELCCCLCASLGHSCEHSCEHCDPCCCLSDQHSDPCCCCLPSHHYDPCCCFLPAQSDVYLAISEPTEGTPIFAAKTNAQTKMK